jgi:hypothetical protein
MYGDPTLESPQLQKTTIKLVMEGKYTINGDIDIVACTCTIIENRHFEMDAIDGLT